MPPMRHQRAEEWEDRLNDVLKRADRALEEEFGARLPPHPARPAHGSTANPQQDGLFRVTAAFTAGFGSRLGKGYALQIEAVTLGGLPPELRRAVEARAVALIRDGLGASFPGRNLDVRRDGGAWKITGDLSLGALAPEPPRRDG